MYKVGDASGGRERGRSTYIQLLGVVTVARGVFDRERGRLLSGDRGNGPLGVCCLLLRG